MHTLKPSVTIRLSQMMHNSQLDRPARTSHALNPSVCIHRLSEFKTPIKLARPKSISCEKQTFHSSSAIHSRVYSHCPCGGFVSSGSHLQARTNQHLPNSQSHLLNIIVTKYNTHGFHSSIFPANVSSSLALINTSSICPSPSACSTCVASPLERSMRSSRCFSRASVPWRYTACEGICSKIESVDS